MNTYEYQIQSRVYNFPWQAITNPIESLSEARTILSIYHSGDPLGTYRVKKVKKVIA